ncbi:hypothetical protein MUP01_01085 [Candidatus Bathyarchaeota archaeon]|nr:hypothetical protein [Candidatus Bathyarchaeota archaeon]
MVFVRKAFSVTMLALLLASMLTLAFKVQPIETSGTIVAQDNYVIDPTIGLTKQEVSMLSGAPSTEWNKTYGGSADDSANSLVQTDDGGYALAGYTSSFGVGRRDFWLVKTDSAGSMQWNKTYGGAGFDVANCVVMTADGGYALSGYTNSSGSGSLDFWLVKTDASGNKQWDKTYGGTNDDAASSLVRTGDGGYALAGWTTSFGSGGHDEWLVKTDANGEMLWNKTCGGAGEDGAFSLVYTSDGGYATTGQTSSFGSGGLDFWLVKIAGAPPLYDALIYADDYSASGNCIAVHFVVNENYATQYTTPYELGLRGTNSLRAIDMQDAKGHPFWKWSTGQTSTLIQVNEPGTYWIRYRASHDVALTDLKCANDFVDYGKNLVVQIFGENRGTCPESFLVDVKVNGKHNQYAALTLQPDEKNSVTVCISTIGLPTGQINIGAKAVLATELSVDWTNNEAPTRSITVRGIGYCIIVAGKRSDGLAQDLIDKDCNLAYKTLRSIGFQKTQIYYLNPSDQYIGGENVVTAYSSSANLQSSITYAASQVSTTCPLYLYMNDHEVKTSLVSTQMITFLHRH